MTVSTRRTATLAALGLAGGTLLSPPALAMTDLVQGYALAASAPPTAQSPTPPPTDATGHAQAQSNAGNPQAEGSRGAHHKHDDAKTGSAATPPATKAATGNGQAATGQADKGMEGKCGEGKCGGSH